MQSNFTKKKKDKSKRKSKNKHSNRKSLRGGYMPARYSYYM